MSLREQGAHRAHYTAYRKGDLRDTDSLNSLSANQGRTELTIQPPGKAGTNRDSLEPNGDLKGNRYPHCNLQPGGIDLRDTDSFTAV